ncbi:hypothetical protein HID58_086500 [Brassica napus]|uniref:Transmembrane protein n=1 Tax=Brassica napus TaxID=3708 RepID=A0ABQ7XS00_BRANA|nr:hypothetical protein HID58_086500 [Brassica napus]
MILRRWDPGIGKDECDGGDKAYYDNHGERHRRLSPDHGERHRRLDLDIVGTGEGILGNLRKLRIMDDWGLISIIITKSQISEVWFCGCTLMVLDVGTPGVGPRHIIVGVKIGYWCYSRVRIGSIEYIHPTAYVVFFGTVVAVAAFGLYLVEGGKDQVIFWRCDYRFCCSKLYTNVVCIYAGSKCIIRQLETIKRFSRW